MWSECMCAHGVWDRLTGIQALTEDKYNQINDGQLSINMQ